MPPIEFSYTRHKGYLLPIIPISINSHKVWVFVDSGATFSMLTVDEATRIGIDWQSGQRQMIVVGDGSYILLFTISPSRLAALKSLLPWVSLSALELDSIFSDALASSINLRFASMTTPAE